MSKFYINILLRRALDSDNSHRKQVSDLDEQAEAHTRWRRGYKVDSRASFDADMIDLDGPKLYIGAKSWLLFYQIIALMNWAGVPLYLSIVYKLVAIVFSLYWTVQTILNPFLSKDIISTMFTNPIFTFTALLAIGITGVQFALTIYINLFNLGPLMKIITSPRLCYLDYNVQQILGQDSFFVKCLFLTYNTLVIRMLTRNSYAEFLAQFNLASFALDLFTQSLMLYHFVGMNEFDFYLRSCFGAWIMGLVFNLESRFERFSIYRRHQVAKFVQAISSPSSYSTCSSSTPMSSSSQTRRSELMDETNQAISTESNLNYAAYKFINMSEIRNELNNMDDHLEIWRNIQATPLAVISLGAFLNNGLLWLLSYNLLANQKNYYHGLLMLSVAINYWLLISFTYSGDQWLSYALSRFVQTIEDGYFLQGVNDDAQQGVEADKPIDHHVSSDQRYFNHLKWTLSQNPHLKPRSRELEVEVNKFACRITQQHRFLLIRKGDMLFCREFVNQFEDHLASPWSKLTYKSHLRMLGAFFTLIAAQIIFDREH